MFRYFILFGLISVYPAQEYHGSVEPTDVIRDVNPENEELNSVYDVKVIPYLPTQIRNLELLSTVISGDYSTVSSKFLSTDKSPEYDTVPSTSTEQRANEDVHDPGDSPTPGLTEGAVVLQNSELSDIPADGPGQPPVSTDPPSDQGTQEQNGTSPPSLGTSATGTETSSQKTVEVTEEVITTGPSEIPPESSTSESSVRPGSQSEEPEQPVQSTEVSYSVDDMNKRKGPSVTTATSTAEKIPEKDTPPYPPYPSIPTDEEGVLRPQPPRRGQLDIRISIPHIFHLSLGDAPDGRRRLGIQAPFFKLDLTRPRLFKVFRK